MLSCYDKNGELYATGSAFAAFEEGVFITNCHVIKDEVYSIKAQMEAGLEFDISSVVVYDDERDLAILRTEAETGLEPLPLGSSVDLEKGEKVIAIGSPLGLINTLSIGLYSGTLKDEQTFLQFSAAISHGSSGGALFNNKGEVVGITSASFTDGQNLNLAIPIEAAVDLWEKHDEAEELSIPEFYDQFIPTLPLEIRREIDISVISFEEYKREKSIAEQLGLEESFNDLLTKGYRLYKVIDNTELTDREFQYNYDIALKMGLAPDESKRFIIQ